MPALTTFEVTPDHPVPISPQGGTASVTVLSGDTLYYADTPQVSAANNQGSVTAGNVRSFTNPAWVRSASLSTVLVQIAAPPAAALLGSDGSVGGPGGTPLASTVISAAHYGPDTSYNQALGNDLPNLQNIGLAGAHSNVAYGTGTRGGGVPTTGNLAQITTGYDNVAIGAGAMPSATTDHSNVAVGADSLSGQNGANNNVGIGAQAAESLTTGSKNTAVGSAALQNATTGSNEAFGASALLACTTGTQNVAVGSSALAGITTANSCTAVGYTAAFRPTGNNNTAVGNNALQGAVGSTASDSVAIGQNALLVVSTGVSNVAVGRQALNAVTGGGSNTAVGWGAGLGTIVNGANNTMLGASAGRTDGTTATTDNNSMTLIGEQAQATTSNVIVLGKAIATRPNLIFGGVGAATAFGGGVGVFAIQNVVTAPATNPTGGGVLYASAGALVWKGSAGTVTTIAAA